MRAGRSGTARPCSHSCTVRTLNPNRLANSFCEKPSRRRIALTSGSRGLMIRRQSRRDMSGAVSASAAIIASISSSVVLRMRARSARGLDLTISLRERLTVGIAFSPLRRTRGNDPAPVAAPRVHHDESFRADFACLCGSRRSCGASRPLRAPAARRFGRHIQSRIHGPLGCGYSSPHPIQREANDP